MPVPVPAFGEVELYSLVFDRYEHEVPVMTTISDDLADIDRDLRCGFVEYDAGRLGDAAWHWRLGFDDHRGAHAMSGLRAIHWALARVGPGA